MNNFKRGTISNDGKNDLLVSYKPADIKTSKYNHLGNNTELFTIRAIPRQSYPEYIPQRHFKKTMELVLPSWELEALLMPITGKGISKYSECALGIIYIAKTN